MNRVFSLSKGAGTMNRCQPSRAAMKTFPDAFKLGGFCAIRGLALFGASAILGSFQGARDFLGNPLGFSQTVAPSGAVVLMQLQKLARLETGKYNGQAIVTGENKGVLPVFVAGDRLVLIAHGEVVAGIDLAKLKAEDVVVNGEKVRIKLPASEVFYSRLDNKTSEVFERQTGIFSRPDRDLESQTRLEAENRLREAALQNGLLEGAQKNAQDAIRAQMKLLGIEDVEFV